MQVCEKARRDELTVASEHTGVREAIAVSERMGVYQVTAPSE